MSGAGGATPRLDPHEAARSVVSVAGLAAVALGGGTSGVLAGLAIVPDVFASLLRRVLHGHVRHLVLAFLGAAAAGALVMGQGAEAVLWLLVGLQLHARLSPDVAAGSRLSLLTATLLLVGASTRTTSPWFLVVWGAWAALLPWAMAWPQRTDVGHPAHRRWRLRFALGVPSIALVVFLVLPRWPLPGGAGGTGQGRTDVTRAFTGFSEQVRLGDFDRLDDDPAVVAEVRFEDGAPEPVVLRAGALDRFDGRTWQRAVARRPTPAWDPGPGRRLRVAQSDLGGTVLLPGTPVGIEGLAVVQDHNDGFATDAQGPLAFEAVVRLGGPFGPRVLRPHARERYLQRPEGLDPRVGALAGRLVDGAADDAARVDAIAEHVAREHTYARVAVHGGEDPVATFLFETRAGHCEYFATATVLLLRSAGLPARVATGFVAGEALEDGFRFRRLHAHAWTEVHLAGVGWVPLDTTRGAVGAPPAPPPDPPAPDAKDPPTPRPPDAVSTRPPSRPPAPPVPWSTRLRALWEAGVLGYDRGVQAMALRTLGRTGGTVGAGGALLLVALLAGALVLRAWGARRARIGPARRRAGPAASLEPEAIEGLLEDARDALRAAGFDLPPELPALAQVGHLRVLGDTAEADGLEALVWLHYEVRYGGEPAGPRLAAAREALATLRAHLRAGAAP